MRGEHIRSPLMMHQVVTRHCSLQWHNTQPISAQCSVAAPNSGTPDQRHAAPRSFSLRSTVVARSPSPFLVLPSRIVAATGFFCERHPAITFTVCLNHEMGLNTKGVSILVVRGTRIPAHAWIALRRCPITIHLRTSLSLPRNTLTLCIRVRTEEEGSAQGFHGPCTRSRTTQAAAPSRGARAGGG